MSTMNTFSGKKFDPMEICPDDIRLDDIAHALSLLCRGGGHMKYFYSVGQHSINCMKEAKARGWSKRIQFACLMHDASEAYISDIIRPVKMHLENYLEIEDMIAGKILEKFWLEDLTEEENKQWKQIDDDILSHELKMLMEGERDSNPQPLYAVPDLSERAWRDVEKEFLALAEELSEEIKREKMTAGNRK